MRQIKKYAKFISLLTRAPSAQKCAGFAQFWEANCAPASHIVIDNQLDTQK
jgi:hypothetical protein